MAKLALLIGVSDYQPGLTSLPGAIQDIRAMQKVLQNPEIADFDEVSLLSNPDPQSMQEAIELLFSGRKRDDLTLLFFSGHGIKDDRGRLYFATCLTRKNSHGELIKATAVPASFVQDTMSQSRSRRQVVILDCCFSGAFAEGMTAKGDDGGDTVDIEAQLGGEGRAVLTSSTSTQYSFEYHGKGCSVYTTYIVEGIETGGADLDSDGLISIDELHNYARRKVQEAAPAMQPKLYATEEGFKINLARALRSDPKLIYRKEVERFARHGEISAIARLTLDQRRESLNVSPAEAEVIEAEVLKPYRVYQEKLTQYEQVLAQAIRQTYPLSEATQRELRYCQAALCLRDEDVEAIAHRLIPKKFTASVQPRRSSSISPRLLAIASAVTLATVSISWWLIHRLQAVVPAGSDSSSITPPVSPLPIPSNGTDDPLTPDKPPTDQSSSEDAPTPSNIPGSGNSPTPRDTPTSIPSPSPDVVSSSEASEESREPVPTPSTEPVRPRIPPQLVPASSGQESIAGQVESATEVIDASYLLEVEAGQQLQIQIESEAAWFDICPRIEDQGSCLALNMSAEDPFDKLSPTTGIYRINVLTDRPTDYILKVYVDGVPYGLPES